MLNSFTATRRDVAQVRASVDEVWALLVQPEVLVRHTPFLHAIEDLGDGRWRWEVGGIRYPGGQFTTSFTERMTFEPGRRILFRHEPVSSHELAGAEGRYELSAAGSGTTLEIEASITARLPAPRRAAPVIRKAMDVVIGQMGRAFAAGLLKDLGER
jgi:carbon monoxide dehydrogenase subunit G